MPGNKDNMLLQSPDPEDVMLLFEIMDREKQGSVTIADLGIRLSEGEFLTLINQ